MPASDIAITCEEVYVDYAIATGSVRALNGVTLTLHAQRFTAIGGPSGSGKSTLLRVLAGLQAPSTGSVGVGTNELSVLPRRKRRAYRRYGIGIVLQEPSDNLFAYLTAVEQLDLAAQLRGADRPDAMALLGALGLAEMADQLPAELSGGEQQRLAFAVAAVGRPAVILADEPTAELDHRSAADVIAAMRTLVADGSTVVVTSHDHAVVAAADHVVDIRDGRVVDRPHVHTDGSP